MRRMLYLLATLVPLVSLFPAASYGGSTCVFVLGSVGGQTVTTPAILVAVPDNSVDVDPVQVHVDPTTQQIAGYSLTTPGLDGGTEAQRLYVPAVSAEVPDLTATVPQLNLSVGQCVAAGVTTPAIPVYVPASQLNTPGAEVTLPTIAMNILGRQVTLYGQMITVGGRSVIVPGVSQVIPSQTIATPDQTITVDLNGQMQRISFLVPQA